MNGSPSGRQGPTAGREPPRSSRTHLLRSDDGEPIWRLSRNYANQLSFSPDGRWIGAACDDGTVRVIDAVSGTQRWSARLGEDDLAQSVGFQPGREVAGGGRVLLGRLRHRGRPATI
jgi:WD40 repeat protein